MLTYVEYAALFSRPAPSFRPMPGFCNWLAIFGFHTQQAIEKGLKAWLAALGATYPKTHDMRLLLAMLEERRQNVGELWDLLEFSPYAVQFRYDWTPEDSPLDRKEIVERVTAVLTNVTGIVERKAP